jgi:hypothetical protein
VPDLLICQPLCRSCWFVGLRAGNVVVGLRVDLLLASFGNLPMSRRCCRNFQLFFTTWIFILLLTCNFFFSVALGGVVEPCRRVAGVARWGIPSWSIAGIPVAVSRPQTHFYVLHLWTLNNLYFWICGLYVIYCGFWRYLATLLDVSFVIYKCGLWDIEVDLWFV